MVFAHIEKKVSNFSVNTHGYKCNSAYVHTHVYRTCMFDCINDLVELPAECYLWHARDLLGYYTHTSSLSCSQPTETDDWAVCVCVFLVQTVLANIISGGVYVCIFPASKDTLYIVLNASVVDTRFHVHLCEMQTGIVCQYLS